MKITAVLTALAVAASISFSAQAQDVAPTPEDIAATLPVRALGQADAPVTIDVYASFACADCAAWFSTQLPVLQRDYIDTGVVRLIFRDAPSEPYALTVTAAMIGLCAAPGRFFDVADAFWEGLPSLQAGGTADAWLSSARSLAGVEDAAMDACLENEQVYDQVRLQTAVATVSGVTSLPAVLVNGVVLDDTSMDGIRAALDAETTEPTSPTE